MQIGWKEINGKWYYLDTSGVMQTNTIKRNHFELHFNNNGYIENLKATMSSNFYSEPSFNSKRTGIIQSDLYSIKNMIVDNWIEIQINQTSGWIYLDGNPSDSSEISYNEFVVQAPTALYDEASFSKKNKDILYPRTVVVTEERLNGWKKIKTSNFEKWIAPNGIKYNLQRNIKQYFKPSFDEKEDGIISPQTVTVLDEQPDGWKKILTDNGTRWIAPEGVNFEVKNTQTLYSSPDYKSNTAGNLAPQTVKVIDAQENGWLKIKTSMGEKWIAPKGVTYELKQNVALYKGPSFLTEKEMYGLMPQTVMVLEDRADGWKRIKTAYGDRWIVPDGVPYQIAKPTQLYKNYDFYGLEGTIASEKVAIIGEQPGGWYQIKSSKGKHWIAPKGIKYRMKEDLKYTAVNDLMSPSIGTIPKGTIVTMIENDKILWNGQYVYGFLTYFSREAVEKIDWDKYTRQPNVYASLSQIKNVVTNGHDDAIDKQEWDDIKKWLSEPPMQIKFDFTNDIDYAEFDKLMGEAKKHLKSSNEIFDTVFVEINDAIRLANEGMQQMNAALNGTNSTNKGMNEAIKSANEGMQQMIEALNGTNSAINSANEGMQQMIEALNGTNSAINSANEGMQQMNTALNGTNSAINSANEGMQQMIEALNGTNSAMKGMNEAIKSANEGMQQMIQGVNQANSGLQGMNNAIDQSNAAIQQMNTGIQKMLNATNKIQQGLEKAISGVDVSVNEINSIIDAPTKAPQSDLKTIHLDFDFSNIVPTSSPEEKLRQQQRDEAMYNILAGMPFTGNFVSLGELISGKNLNSEEDLKASDYALNMLAVLAGGEIKAGAAFFGSISKVTKRQKLTTTKVDLSWLERFGDKYQAVEVTGTAKVLKQTSILDRRVYQMKDIDWNYVSSNPQAKGLSNLELAKKGRNPFYKDDTQIQLHHTTQREPGSMVELPASKHRKYTKQLHGTIEDGESFRNDPVLTAQYERFRDYYWKQRAQDYQK
ncbi:TPA: hypothetical protein QCX20_005481 [Bacillus toyonensis]|nr:hypothetical protein [Bacillus toyonensis]